MVGDWSCRCCLIVSERWAVRFRGLRPNDDARRSGFNTRLVVSSLDDRRPVASDRLGGGIVSRCIANGYADPGLDDCYGTSIVVDRVGIAPDAPVDGR